jgi:hypothetical protein
MCGAQWRAIIGFYKVLSEYLFTNAWFIGWQGKGIPMSDGKKAEPARLHGYNVTKEAVAKLFGRPNITRQYI